MRGMDLPCSGPMCLIKPEYRIPKPECLQSPARLAVRAKPGWMPVANSIRSGGGGRRKRTGQTQTGAATVTGWSTVAGDPCTAEMLRPSCPKNVLWRNSDPISPVGGQGREGPSRLALASSWCALI